MTDTADEARAKRQVVIDQAIEFIDATDPTHLSRLFTRAGAREEFRRDPVRLRDMLAAADPSDAGRFIGAYHAAVVVLHVAGQPAT